MRNRAQLYKSGDFSLGQAKEFVDAYGRQGGTPDFLQKAIEDQKLMSRIVQSLIVKNFVPTPKDSSKSVREIMGKSYLGPEASMEHYGVAFTEKELAQLCEVPFTEKELDNCKYSYILVADYGLSISEIYDKVGPAWPFDYDEEGAWYRNKAFAQKKGDVRWRLVLKQMVHESSGKTWKRQQALIPRGEKTPEVRTMVYSIILYVLTTDERPLSGIYVRCDDIYPAGKRIAIGKDGLQISTFSDEDENDLLGVTTEVLPQ